MNLADKIVHALKEMGFAEVVHRGTTHRVFIQPSWLINHFRSTCRQLVAAELRFFVGKDGGFRQGLTFQTSRAIDPDQKIPGFQAYAKTLRPGDEVTPWKS